MYHDALFIVHWFGALKVVEDYACNEKIKLVDVINE